VKDHFGVKVNDVVVALVAGALRDDLQARDGLPESPLVAQIPVSVRTDDERRTFGNQIRSCSSRSRLTWTRPRRACGTRRTPTRGEGSPRRAAGKPCATSPSSSRPRSTPARPARSWTSRPRLGLRPPYNVVISNVPGRRWTSIRPCARLEALYPISIITDGATLNVTLMSYRESIDIAITADRELTPDVQAMRSARRRAGRAGGALRVRRRMVQNTGVSKPHGGVTGLP
jgi:hypothetical protein